LSNGCGVSLRVSRGRVEVGVYEAQVTHRREATLEALNLSGEWEILLRGSELEVRRFVDAANRLMDLRGVVVC
jgi:hypothetical protein